MSATFRTGYRRNPRRASLRSFSAHPAAGTTYPTHVDLSGYAPAIMDQGQTGSCVGHARSRGLYTSFAFAGKRLPFVPSPAELYKLARCLEVFDPTAPLSDNGCDPADSITAASQWGLRAMGPMAPDGRYSDADPNTINVRPSVLNLEADANNLADGDRQVTTQDAERIAEICSALASGCAVCVDVPGGSSQWQNYTGGVLVDVPGAPRDHYVTIVGYDVDLYGVVTYLIHNSWGLGWGQAGTCKADQSVITSATDPIVNVSHLATP